MKKLVITLIAVFMLAGTVLAAIPAQAEETKAEPWSVEFDLTYATKYIWRGIVVVDDPVLQPSMTVSKGAFSFNVWGDWNLTDINGTRNDFDEIDLTAEYAFAYKNFSFPVGAIYYTFPNGGHSTVELYAGVSYDWIVSPSLTIYRDVDQVQGWYILGALDFSHDLPSSSKMISWAVEIGVSIAYGDSDYNTGYYGADVSGFTDAKAYLSLPIGIGEYVTVTPAVTYTALVDDDIKDAMSAQDDSDVVFSLGVTVTW